MATKNANAAVMIEITLLRLVFSSKTPVINPNTSKNNTINGKIPMFFVTRPSTFTFYNPEIIVYFFEPIFYPKFDKIKSIFLRNLLTSVHNINLLSNNVFL